MSSIYRVLLDGQLYTETEHEIAAWATYRATLRRVVLKSLMLGRLRESDVRDAARAMGYPVSGSRIQGWLAAPGNRRYQAMTLDELAVIVAGLNTGSDR